MLKKPLFRFDQKIFNGAIRRKLKSQKTHLYCAGTAKSGTHSIIHLFKGILRSMHEPEIDQLRKLYFRIRNGTISEYKLKQIVEKREKRLHLELNSSCFNHIIIDQLVALYPKAKFIHPIRSPRAWLNSWMNHHINYRGEEVHDRFRGYLGTIYRWGEIPYAPEEKILLEMELPTIEGMLSYWRWHNLKILNTVPEDRILVLQTKDISKKIKSIYEFAGITEIPDMVHSHSNKASEKHKIVDSIDYEFVEQKINKYALNARVDDNFLSHSPLS